MPPAPPPRPACGPPRGPVKPGARFARAAPLRGAKGLDRPGSGPPGGGAGGAGGEFWSVADALGEVNMAMSRCLDLVWTLSRSGALGPDGDAAWLATRAILDLWKSLATEIERRWQLRMPPLPQLDACCDLLADGAAARSALRWVQHDLFKLKAQALDLARRLAATVQELDELGAVEELLRLALPGPGAGCRR